MAKLTEAEVLETIRNALEDTKGEITLDSGIGSVEAWDSLGHLAVLAALDARLEGKAAGIQELADAKSIRAILELLRAHQLA